MIKIILILLSPLLLLCAKYPHFSKKDFLKIEQRFGKIAKNRVMDYQTQVMIFKKSTKHKQLNLVNSYLNQLLPQYDAVIQNEEDYWASPKEFLTTGYGDCEDYAIIKYYTLVKLGFDEEKLYITTVNELFSGGYHMVLSYFKEDGKSPLILDNLSFRILNLKTRKDIKADTFTNSKGVFKLSKTNQLIKIANSSLLYNSLIKKIEKNH